MVRPINVVIPPIVIEINYLTNRDTEMRTKVEERRNEEYDLIIIFVSRRRQVQPSNIFTFEDLSEGLCMSENRD